MSSSKSTTEMLHSSPLKGQSVMKALLKISLPLMLASLSSTLMIVADRAVLAHLSIEAMNAAVLCGMIFSAFQYCSMTVAAITEVFVGQRNGAKEWHRLGEPVWQMLYFSLGTALIFWPCALFPHLFLPKSFDALGGPYLAILFWFGPVSPMIAALVGFYIGQGKVKLVTISFIVSNIANLLFAILFVFGLDPWIPAMGMYGAGLAMGLGQVINFLILFVVFLNRAHRREFKTHHYHFDKTLFIRCLQKGLPCAVGRFVELMAWILSMYLLADISETHFTVTAVAQNCWILFLFMAEGLNKGVMALASNEIGRKSSKSHQRSIGKILNAGFWASMLFSGILLIPLFIFPEHLIAVFLVDTSQSAAENASLTQLLIIVCHWLWFGFIFELLLWVLLGILTAAGDTKFLMFMMIIASWAYGLLPIYIGVYILNGSASLTPKLWSLYSALTALSFFVRYRRFDWAHVKRVDAAAQENPQIS